MTIAAELVARIAAEVADLAGRVRPAADLAELVRQGALPQGPRTAFVLPLGLVARSEGDAGAGAFVQPFDELVAVVLVLRSAGDVTGHKALAPLDQLVWQIIAAVCGWAPEEATGVLRLVRGQLLSAEAGALQYQIDFALRTEVRLLS